MALNFSNRPIFLAHLFEKNLVPPMRIGNGYVVDGVQEKSGDGFGKAWHDVGNCFDYGRDRCDTVAAQESVSKDIIDLLPSDPFGMDISTTFTAITGWLEDLEVDYGGYRRDELGAGDENYLLFAGLNFIWSNAMRFHAFPGNVCIEKKPHVSSGFGECSQKKVGAASCIFGFGSACNIGDMLGFGCSYKDVGIGACNMGDMLSFGCNHKDVGIAACNMGDMLGVGCNYKDVGIASLSCDTYMDNGNHLEGDELAPHPALCFSLSYLGVRDLLVVERVCKSLRSTVRGDPLLWRSIHIDQPLNERITDDLLLQLANRAQGNLQSLSLVECTRITDDGLKRVLEVNPKLTKLSVPACTRLSIEGIVNILKAFKSMGTHGVKHLRIGGIYGVTPTLFEELKLLLGSNSHMLQHSRKPRFYHRGNLYLSCDDDQAIDIEVCPRCQNLTLVYDCPAEGCQGVGHATELCRACTLCIARCSQCGRCINDNEYEETFCLEFLCYSCYKQLVKCPERMDRKVGPTKSVVLQEQSYGLCHDG